MRISRDFSVFINAHKYIIRIQPQHLHLNTAYPVWIDVDRRQIETARNIGIFHSGSATFYDLFVDDINYPNNLLVN